MAERKRPPRRDRGRYDRSVYRAFALVMQFGINMLVPIGMMSALGVFLDRKLGTSYIMVLLFFVGAIAGAQNVYRMAKRVYEADPEERKPLDRRGEDPGGREEEDRDAEKGK